MMQPIANPRQVFVLSGPSGVGKNTIAGRLLEMGRAVRAVTATTRPPKAGEVDGVDYRFLTREEFDRWIEGDRFAEHATYVGHSYGTPFSAIRKAASAGVPVILTIEVDGGLQIRHRVPEATLIFVEPPSEAELRRRLQARGRDDTASIERRLRRARQEMAYADKYDHRVVNDDLDRAVADVARILEEHFVPADHKT